MSENNELKKIIRQEISDYVEDAADTITHFLSDKIDMIDIDDLYEIVEGLCSEIAKDIIK